LWVNPQGTQILSAWVVSEGSAIKKDLWISDIAGGNLARLTATDGADRAVWSPDGGLVAFAIRPEVTCTGFDCTGAVARCDLRYTAASRRDVSAGSADAPDLRVPDTAGRSVILGCDVQGWTP
ncbi:MAG: six-bladed beta-propeller, TolB-like protein, partial [Chitinophagaceae bacterium]|nr:six-bladed beta-propeller, TolB-like protein [Rubrivivax sp.]